MSYAGYVPILCEYAGEMFRRTGKPVKILEIGVLQGTTTFSRATSLSHLKIPFFLDAVDIFIRAEVRQQKDHTLAMETVNFIEANSLELPEKLTEIIISRLLRANVNFSNFLHTLKLFFYSMM